MKSRTFAALFLVLWLIQPAFSITYEEMNTIFGIPIWADDNLWDDNADVVAARLDWPKEPTTVVDPCYRKFPKAAEQVIECRPYSMALHASNGQPARIFMMFANKIDRENPVIAPGDAKAASNYNKLANFYKAAIREDADHIARTLTAFLGKPVSVELGQGDLQKTLRWTWNDHALVLSAPPDDFVALQILPIHDANALGKPRPPDSSRRNLLFSRIGKRPNGDVILTGLPKIRYPNPACRIPATWESVMRYIGIPADSHLLAMALVEKQASPASGDAIPPKFREAARQGGYQVDTESGKASARTVKKYIDSGIPVVWTTPSMASIQSEVNSRMNDRALMNNPVEWKKYLALARSTAKKPIFSPVSNSVTVIIGYNEETGEIAISDPCDLTTDVRWITQEEAFALSQNRLLIIQ